MGNMNFDKISVVIVCKNAELTIGKAIQSAREITNDIVIIDTGSCDNTLEIIKGFSPKLIQSEWMGYGATKNYANTFAKNKWILALDADEYIDPRMAQSLLSVDLSNEKIVYGFMRINYLGAQAIKHGEWGKDIITRLFNIVNSKWDTTWVHEQLAASVALKKIILPGCIHHLTAPDIATYKRKLKQYALLMAKKYREGGKKVYWHKLYISPVASFLNNYFMRKGFLDGKSGYQIALASAMYTFEKYHRLKQLSSAKN